MIVAIFSSSSQFFIRSGARGECQFKVRVYRWLPPVSSSDLNRVPTWPAVWSKAIPMTANWLLTLPGFESLLGLERLIDVGSSGGLVSLSATPTYMRPSTNLAEKLTKNENSKFWSQRVPERQGLPTARSL